MLKGLEIKLIEARALTTAEWQEILDLYSKLGWVFRQGPLYIRHSEGLLATPEERVMILRLPKTPPLNLKASLSAEWRAGELW